MTMTKKMKASSYVYGVISIFLVPVLIGSGIEEFLLHIYNNFSQHWIAGLAVCLLAGAVASWPPMLFMMDGDIRFSSMDSVALANLIGWIGGVGGPLIFGFGNLGIIIAVLLILTTLMTMVSVSKLTSQK